MTRIDDYLKAIAENIRYYRKKSGLTHRALAELIGATGGNIVRIESGKHNISLRTILQVAAALEISPEELISAKIHLSKSDAKKSK